MQFIALQDGQTVVPEAGEDGGDVFCPTCNAATRARGLSIDGAARPFYHITTDASGGCRGQTDDPGESETHRELKFVDVCMESAPFGVPAYIHNEIVLKLVVEISERSPRSLFESFWETIELKLPSGPERSAAYFLNAEREQRRNNRTAN